MKQKPTRAPIAQRGRQRPQEQASTRVAMARTSRSAFGVRAVLHQRRRQRLSRPSSRPSAQGLGLLRVRQGRRGQDVVDQIKRRCRPAAAASTRTCRRRRGDRARRSRRDATRPRRAPPSVAADEPPMAPTLFVSDLHLSPARPAPVAAFHAFARRARARRRGAVRARRPVRLRGSATTSCASRSPPTSRASLRGVSDAGVPRLRRARQSRLPAGRALRAGGRRDAAARAAGHRRRTATPTLLMHGDELCTDDVDYQRYRARIAQTRVGSARLLALPLLRAPRHRVVAAAREPQRQRAEAGVDHGRRRRRRRRRVARARRARG